MKATLVAAMLLAPFALFAAPAGTSLSGSLESKAIAAYGDINKAKAALNAGNTKTSQTWLAKSQGLLKSVLSKTPGQSAASAQQGSSALSEAESEAGKLDPSLGSKLGMGGTQSTQGAAQSSGSAGETSAPQSNGPEATVPAPSQDNAPRKTTLSELEDTYKKVSLAQSLLKGGETSKAKSLLDAIPTSPSGLLKNVTGRGQ